MDDLLYNRGDAPARAGWKMKGRLNYMKFVCNICGWEYDEAAGDPEHGIAPGTAFADLPDDFECPLCGVGKDEFSEA